MNSAVEFAWLENERWTAERCINPNHLTLFSQAIRVRFCKPGYLRRAVSRRPVAAECPLLLRERRRQRHRVSNRLPRRQVRHLEIKEKRYSQGSAVEKNIRLVPENGKIFFCRFGNCTDDKMNLWISVQVWGSPPGTLLVVRYRPPLLPLHDGRLWRTQGPRHGLSRRLPRPLQQGPCWLLTEIISDYYWKASQNNFSEFRLWRNLRQKRPCSRGRSSSASTSQRWCTDSSRESASSPTSTNLSSRNTKRNGKNITGTLWGWYWWTYFEKAAHYDLKSWIILSFG